MATITTEMLGKSIDDRLAELGEHLQFVIDFAADSISLCLAHLNAALKEEDPANMNGIIYTEDLFNANMNLVHAIFDYYDSFNAYANVNENELNPNKNIEDVLRRLTKMSQDLSAAATSKTKDAEDACKFLKAFEERNKQRLKQAPNINVKSLMEDTMDFLKIKNYFLHTRSLNSCTKPLERFEDTKKE